MNAADNLLQLAMDAVYLDNAASTPLLPEVAAAYPRIHASCFANPSATHKLGFALRRQLDQQATDLLQLLGIRPEEAEVIWTSGGTEANNLALFGSARNTGALATFRALTSATEHASVQRTLQSLATDGAEIATVPVNADGSLRLESLRKLLRPDTQLVSICLVQNETGACQDLPAVRAILQELAPQARLHVDAVQACCKVPIPWREAKLDLVSVSSHKVHGPGGVGALIIRRDLKLTPLFQGGGQQRNLRSGSLDAIGIHCFVEAVRQLARRTESTAVLIRALNTRLRSGLLLLKDRRGNPLPVKIISPESGSPYILAFSLPGFQGAVLSRLLGEQTVIVGTGSACAAESKKPSAVLTAMGYSDNTAFGALRVSFGAQNTPEDVDRFLAALQATTLDY